MTKKQKVRYLKIDRGRYFYQRRVPTMFQRSLNLKMWRRPCGNVSYSKAVQLIVTWAEEHDALIRRLRDPEELEKASNEATRKIKRDLSDDMENLGLPRFYEMSQQLPGEKQYYPRESLPRPWQAAAKILENADAARRGQPSPIPMIAEIDRRIEGVGIGEPPTYDVVLPDYAPVIDYLEKRVDPDVRQAARIVVGEPVEPLGNLDYLDLLREAFDIGFGPGVASPEDIDDREEFEFIKRKLERKISDLLPDPNTISAVAERYYTFARIRPITLRKYRKNIALLVDVTGDVPIQHVGPSDLRRLRDKLLERLLPASVQAAFTPIKGVFGFALDDQLIEVNPAHGVKLPKDRRPVEERKWLPFTPDEFTRIITGIDTLWADSVRGLSDERRIAIRMVVRVLAFTAMRPVEVIRLEPTDVTGDYISVTGSKAEGSTRVIPLHPEIADFPAWVASGGLETFRHIQKDPVEPIRHNFHQLIRKKLPKPVIDERKCLYSLRSTFANAMRRAGADNTVRRAILGHVEAGALRHYDDGPEFELKREWVAKTDPRLPYQPVGQRDLDEQTD